MFLQTRYFSKYRYNYGFLKKYGDNCYKLSIFNARKHSGVERKSAITSFARKGTVNESKLQCNLSRTRNTIFELAYCNPWEFFVTFTLDKAKYDRTDLKKFQKDLSQFIRDIGKKHGIHVKYLLIPEQHKDGCWHMHGFLMGLPLEHLHEFQQTEHLPYKILNRLKQGKRVFDWPAYSRKFGFSDIEIVENNEAASRYITKYITKEAFHTIKDLNAHIYYASKGLARATVEHQGIVAHALEYPDFENEYCHVKWFNDKQSALVYFESEVLDPQSCFYPNTFAIGSTE